MNETISQRLRIRAVLWCVVFAASLFAGIGITILAPRMAPIQPGSSHMFWRLAAGVELHPGVADAWGGQAYFVDDTWAAYVRPHMHGSDVYYVRTSDVLSDFSGVVEALQRAQEQGGSSAFVQGYANWRDDNKQPRDGPALLASIKRVRQQELIRNDIDLVAHSLAAEQQFWQRWQRANWYWANIVFEWIFLCGLVLFALWPGIRNGHALQWALHFGLLPVLFLLPTYLGYATYSFTSAGPSGGILYPFLLIWIRGGSVTAFDGWLLTHLPQVLEPLSTPIGSPMVLTGMGMPGPSSAIIAGVWIGGLIFAANTGYCWWCRRRSRRAT